MDAVYVERNSLLVTLGYETYSHYLGSDLWKDIRRRVIQGASGKCRCKRKATQVHHRAYDMGTLLGTSLDKLLAVCGGCHKGIEYDAKAGKRSFTDAEALCEKFVAEGRKAFSQKKKTKKKCITCGSRARKGRLICRRCARINLYGTAKKPDSGLPLCLGADCIWCAQKGKVYCRMHEVEPDRPFLKGVSSKKRIKAWKKSRKSMIERNRRLGYPVPSAII